MFFVVFMYLGVQYLCGLTVRPDVCDFHIVSVLSGKDGDLGGTGGSFPSNIWVEGTEVLLSPQCLENVIANCHSERD